MISEDEKARMHAVGEAVHHMTDMTLEEMNADPSDDALRARAAGAPMATLDALFAIREGKEWRGLTDPKEIARQLLRDAGVGD